MAASRRRLSRERQLLTGLVLCGLPLCGGFAACAEEPAPATSTAVRDSAGIVLVENRVLSDALPQWTLADLPAVDIGGNEADATQQLFSIAGATRLSDGRIAIAEDGNLRLRLYDANGDWLGDAGRSGEGPGEFRDLGRPRTTRGDSIVVYDSRLRRFTLLSPDGMYARNWPLEQPLSGDAVTPALMLAGGDWIARPGFSFSANTPTGLHRGEIPYLRFTFDGQFIDSVGRFPAAETFVYSDDDRSMAMVLPFLRAAQLAASSDGGFWFGSADRYEIERRAADGRLIALIRGSDVDGAMPAGRLETWKREMVDGMEEDQRQFFERVLDALPPVAVLPVYSALRVDDQGCLWVRDHAWPDEASVTWRIFGPDGAVLARIELPSGLSVSQIGEDWLLGEWSDELGIEHVRLYDLDRTGAGRAGR